MIDYEISQKTQWVQSEQFVSIQSYSLDDYSTGKEWADSIENPWNLSDENRR